MGVEDDSFGVGQRYLSFRKCMFVFVCARTHARMFAERMITYARNFQTEIKSITIICLA